MPFPFIAAAMAGGALAGMFGQSSANSANRDIGRDNNLFSARQAQMNRDFQERMSNTAYQRGTADMRAAGINPMLAYSQGGASSPSGNSAQGIAAANQQNELAAAASSAKDALILKSQIDNLAADNRLKNATARNAEAQTKGISATSAYTANKLGFANDLIDVGKTAVGYNGVISSAKQAVKPNFISKGMGDFQNYLHKRAHTRSY